MKRLMLDLETLGTRPGYAIATIGAVTFAGGSITDRFYRRIDLTTVECHGLKIDPDTMLWWMRQPADSRQEISAAEDRHSMSEALSDFAAWCLQAQPEEIWCKGASFDFPILVHAMEACGLRVPWKYSAERCYRTAAALLPQQPRPALASDIKHHALHDAQLQAVHLITLLEFFTPLSLQSSTENGTMQSSRLGFQTGALDAQK